MKNKIQPTILFLNKVSMPMLAGVLIWYFYALLVARSEFPKPVFIALLSLGLIALGLIIKSVYQSRTHNSQPEEELK